MFAKSILSLMLISVTTMANAGLLRSERCIANRDFFKSDQCSSRSQIGSCTIQLSDNNQTVQITTNSTNFIGEITSMPVYGYQDVMNINFGSLIRGALYRINKKITSAEVYINDDSSGATYTKLTCLKK